MARTRLALIGLTALLSSVAWAGPKQVSLWVARNVAPGPKIQLTINTTNVPVVGLKLYRLEGEKWLVQRDWSKRPATPGTPVKAWQVTITNPLPDAGDGYGYTLAVLEPDRLAVGAPFSDTLAPGEAFVPPGRNVAVFRDAEGVFAVSTVCTHLGCIVKPGPEGFDCPCHGSRFDLTGRRLGGPATEGLRSLNLSPAKEPGKIDIDLAG